MTVLTRNAFHLSKHKEGLQICQCWLKSYTCHLIFRVSWDGMFHHDWSNRTELISHSHQVSLTTCILNIFTLHPMRIVQSHHFFKSNLSCKICLFLFCGHWCQILIESVHKVKVLLLRFVQLMHGNYQLFAKSKHVYWIILILLRDY